MPYIEKSRRETLDKNRCPDTAGELNYVITMLCIEFWGTVKGYQGIAEITGVLENVKQEFYRRIATPYEENKIAVNGDVY